MGSGHCCAVSTFLSGCGASSAGMPYSVLLSALCLGPYLASTIALVLFSTCCHSQDEQGVQSLLHFTSQSERNQDSLPLEDDSILMTQRVTDVKVQTDRFRDVTLPGWPSVDPDLFALLHGPPVLSCLGRLAKSSSPSHEHQSQDQEEKHDSGCLQ